jgi:hypothetical protein
MATAHGQAQRISTVIEKTECGTWCVASYLIGSNGQRERRCLATCETHDDASRAIERIWRDDTA